MLRTKFGEDDWTTLQYTVDPIEIYKYPVGPISPEEISFTTSGDPSDCGAQLEIGEEYLIGLYENSLQQLTASSCGLFKKWDDVEDEDRKLLEEGCDGSCKGECGEFQVRAAGR